MTINSAPEDTGVTTFVQEASDCMEILPTAVGDFSIIKPEANLQDLTKYFARPVAISSGLLPLGSSSSVWGQVHTSFATIINNFPNYTARLTGVFGIRATAVFTLQVAATPFHQGVLALSYQYGDVNIATTYRRAGASATCTNLPHVRLDLSSDTMVQLKVPYLSVAEYYPIGTSLAPMYGLLNLNTLLPVNSVTGMSAPAYQIYVHLEDVQLFGASPISTSGVVFQAGRKLSPITEEFEKDSHPYSSALMAASRTARFLAKGVPALSSIGGMTSWFMAKSAGAIRSFGFGKNTICDPIQRYQQIDSIAECNVDVPTGCYVVGPTSTNTLKVSPAFGGTDVDEMALSFLTAQYGQIARFNITTANAAGTLIYACPVSPSAMWFKAFEAFSPPFLNPFPLSVAPTGSSGFIPSHLFYWGQMFRFWRGSIRYRFTFAKSKMHGGRVIVNFAPGTYPTDDVTQLLGGPLTYQVADYGTNGPNPFGYSAVFNLKDGNVFEFDVPYISPKPFVTFTNSIGVVSMHIVDALQASSVVSSSIGVLVEVKGLSDFELADPKSPIYPVHIGATPVFQSGRMLGSQVVDELCEHTVGECITSAKQLIQMPKWVLSAVNSTSKYGMIVQPWFYQPRIVPGTTAPTAFPYDSFGFGGNVSKAFAFVKGGTDIHIYPNQENPTGKAFVMVRQLPNTTNVSTSTGAPGQMPFSNNALILNSSGVLHARLPAYQNLVRYFSTCLDSAVSAGTSWSFRQTRFPNFTYDPYGWPTLYQATLWSQNATTALYSRNASDDAACAGYLGPPPLGLLSVNAATSAYDPDSDYNVS